MLGRFLVWAFSVSDLQRSSVMNNDRIKYNFMFDLFIMQHLLLLNIHQTYDGYFEQTFIYFVLNKNI